MKKIVVSLVLVALFLLSAIFVLPVGTEVTWVKEDSLSKPSSEVASIHQGDLIISGNTNYTIIDERFDINGSIIVEGNATLYLRNAIVNFTQVTNWQDNMTFRNPANGNPRLQAINATITSSYFFLKVYFYGNSSGEIVQQLDARPVTVLAYNSSIISISDSQMRLGGLWIFDSSTVSISDSWPLQCELWILVRSINCSIINLQGRFFGFWNFWLNCSVAVAPGGSAPNVTLVNTNLKSSWFGFGFEGSSNATIASTELLEVGTWDSSVVTISNSMIWSLWTLNSSIVYLSNSTTKYLSALDSSMMSISNSTMMEGGYLSTSDASNVFILNSTIDALFIDSSSVNCSITRLGPGFFSQWNYRLDCLMIIALNGWAPNVTLINTQIQSWHFEFYGSLNATIVKSTISLLVYGSSTVTILNSTISIGAYDSSVVTISNCTILGLNSLGWVGMPWLTLGSPSVSVSNSTINDMDVDVYSVNCSIVGLKPRFFDQWNFLHNCSVVVPPGGYAPNITLKNTQIGNWTFRFEGTSNATISNSLINKLFGYDSSIVTVLNSTIENYVGASGSSVVWLLNSTYGYCRLWRPLLARIYVSWHLSVHAVDLNDTDVPYANVTINYQNGTETESKIADEHGWARFTLIEKMINASGTYAIGNYTVTATYENYSGEQTLSMTGNKQITIRLPFIIPEFPTILILPLLITAALIAVIFRKTIPSNGHKDKGTSKEQT